jgi:hypothetical protein
MATLTVTPSVLSSPNIRTWPLSTAASAIFPCHSKRPSCYISIQLIMKPRLHKRVKQLGMAKAQPGGHIPQHRAIPAARFAHRREFSNFLENDRDFGRDVEAWSSRRGSR